MNFDLENLVSVGKIHQFYGLKGAVKASFETFFMPFVKDLECIFLKDKRATSPIPYFFKDIQVRHNGLCILTLDDVNSKEAAQALVGMEVLVDKSQFEELEDEFEAVHDWDYLIDFTAKDIENQTLGPIQEILYMPHQVLAQIQYQNREVLIPLRSELISSEDKPNKVIIFDLPEGLLDL